MKWEKWCVVTSLLNSQNPLSTNQHQRRGTRSTSPEGCPRSLAAARLRRMLDLIARMAENQSHCEETAAT